jgi:hypothetical protein
MIDSKNRIVIISALFVFIFTTAVYVIWTPYVYSGDDLQQTIVIQQLITGIPYYHPTGGRLYEPGLTESANPAMQRLPINPRYLLEIPTSALVAKIWDIAGWQGGVITPVITYRSIVGGLGVLCLFLALYTLRGNVVIALIGSLGLALTSSYWTYSTHVDQSINMVALICLAFYVLVRQSKSGMKIGGKIGLAAILVFASFYNFTAVLTTLAFGLAVAFTRPNDTLIGRIKQFISFFVIYGVIAAAIILMAVAILVSPAAITNADYWRSVLFAGKPEYGIELFRDTFRAVLGFAKSQVIYPGVPGSLQAYWDSVDNGARLLVGVFYGIVLMAMAIPVAVLALGRRHLPSAERWLWVLLPSWFVLHAVFNWFWDPGFIKYWLIPLVVAWIVIALSLDHAHKTMPRAYRFALAGTVAFIVFTVAMNFTTQFLPESRRADNEWLTIAESLSETQPNALFISTGHPLDFYIAYFSHRDIISTGLINYDTGDNLETLQSILTEQVSRHLADGGEVYLYSDKPDALEGVTLAMDSSDVELELAWEYPNLTIYKAIFNRESLLYTS